MTETLNNIKKIEAMQNQIIKINTSPNDKLDNDCREAYLALEKASQKLTNVFFQLSKEKEMGAA